MKYQSELIKEIVEARGHKQSSLHYESECTETWIEEAKGAYPKLCDYQSEWLNYISILDDTGGEDPEPPIGEFPYETITDVTEAAVDNVVPLAYKSAVLKGQTLVNVVSEQSFGGSNILYESRFINTPIKAGEKMTIFVVNPLVRAVRVGFQHSINGEWSHETNYDVTTNKRIVCTVPKDKFSQYAGVVVSSANNSTGYENSLVILKGDYSQLEISSYFEGIKGVENPSLTTSNEDGTKTNILRVNEDVTLHGISGVRDELNCLTGEVTERIGELVLNGSENWKGPFSGGATVEGMYYYTYEDTRIKRNTTTNVLTTISYGGFASVPFNSVWKKTEEGIASSNSTGLGLRLATKIASAAELKSYLQQNPTTLKYQLATESIKTVDLNIQDQNGKTLSVIKPIEGTMVLSTSSDTIKPLFSGEIPVEAITQNLASFIDLEMEE